MNQIPASIKSECKADTKINNKCIKSCYHDKDHGNTMAVFLFSHVNMTHIHSRPVYDPVIPLRLDNDFCFRSTKKLDYIFSGDIIMGSRGAEGDVAPPKTRQYENHQLISKSGADSMRTSLKHLCHHSATSI